MVVIVLMGVCGSGKSTVGKALAARMNCVFRDADEFHSTNNKYKMSSGIPLTDEDRVPWLHAIYEFIKSLQDTAQTGVVTCSALKRWYRDILRTGTTVAAQTAESHQKASPGQSSNRVVFVLLHGSRELLEQRMGERKGHFMPPSLLSSQLEILDIPEADEDSLMVNIKDSVSDIVETVIRKLNLEYNLQLL